MSREYRIVAPWRDPSEGGIYWPEFELYVADLNVRAERKARERAQDEEEARGRHRGAVYHEKTQPSSSANADRLILDLARDIPFAGDGPDPLEGPE